MQMQGASVQEAFAVAREEAANGSDGTLQRAFSATTAEPVQPRASAPPTSYRDRLVPEVQTNLPGAQSGTAYNAGGGR